MLPISKNTCQEAYKEVITSSSLGVLFGGVAGYCLLAEDLVVQGLALGALNALATRIGFYAVETHRQDFWSVSKAAALGLIMSVSVASFIMPLTSLSFRFGITLLNVFVQNYFSEEQGQSSLAQTSGASIQVGEQRGRVPFYLPCDHTEVVHRIEIKQPISFLNLKGTFEDFKYLVYGLMEFINMSKDTMSDESGLTRYSADILTLFQFKPSNCMNSVGCFLEKPLGDFAVVQTIVPSCFMNLIMGIKKNNENFPKRLLVPITMGAHRLAVAVELQGETFFISGIDSEGRTSMADRAVIQMQQTLRVAYPSFQLKTVIANKSQNNQRFCGYHVALNLLELSLVNGLIFTEIDRANRAGENAKCLPCRSREETYGIIKNMRKVAMLELGHILELNPGKILIDGKPYPQVDLSYDPRSW